MKARYFTEDELIRNRGWPDSAPKKLLGRPSDDRGYPYDMVKEAEISHEFKRMVDRKNRATELLNKKHQEMIDKNG